MTVEILGIVVFVIGLCTALMGSRLAVVVFAVTAVFGAAAAFKLPAMGGASVQPAHVMLMFVVLACLREASVRRCLVETLTFPRAGFWLLVIVLYGVVTAYFLPRIFAGSTLVFLLARAPTPIPFIEIAPLIPRSTNVTQAVYMVSDVVCFALVSAMIMAGLGRWIVIAVTVAGIVHVLLGFIDLGAHTAGLGDVLSFVRNGGYKMLADNEIKAVKRIVGGFTEAGAYTYVSVGFYAFALQLWLQNIRPRFNGVLAAILAVTIILATSTAAYVTFVLYSLIVYAECFVRVRQGSRANLTYLAAGPVALGLLVMGLMLSSAAWDFVGALFDTTLTRKLESSSGVERTSWNLFAIKAFFDTGWFGAGLGSVRTSSFVVAILGNLGAIGVVMFAVFFHATILAPRDRRATDPDAAVRRAARSACLAILISAAITLGSVDLGLFFMIFAALGTTRVHPASNAAPIETERQPVIVHLGGAPHPA